MAQTLCYDLARAEKAKDGKNSLCPCANTNTFLRSRRGLAQASSGLAQASPRPPSLEAPGLQACINIIERERLSQSRQEGTRA